MSQLLATLQGGSGMSPQVTASLQQLFAGQGAGGPGGSFYSQNSNTPYSPPQATQVGSNPYYQAIGARQ